MKGQNRKKETKKKKGAGKKPALVPATAQVRPAEGQEKREKV